MIDWFLFNCWIELLNYRTHWLIDWLIDWTNYDLILQWTIFPTDWLIDWWAKICSCLDPLILTRTENSRSLQVSRIAAPYHFTAISGCRHKNHGKTLIKTATEARNRRQNHRQIDRGNGWPIKRHHISHFLHHIRADLRWLRIRGWKWLEIIRVKGRFRGLHTASGIQVDDIGQHDRHGECLQSAVGETGEIDKSAGGRVDGGENVGGSDNDGAAEWGDLKGEIRGAGCGQRINVTRAYRIGRNEKFWKEKIVNLLYYYDNKFFPFPNIWKKIFKEIILF